MWWSTVQKQIDTRAIEIATESRTRQMKHEDGCETRWKENERKLDTLHERLTTQDEQRMALHRENTDSLDKIRRILYIAMGIGIAITALNTDIGRHFATSLTGDPDRPVTDHGHGFH
jgi:hypothetical protein